jgi:hypothetical protein
VWPAAGVAVAWFGVQRASGTMRFDLVLLATVTWAVNWLTGTGPLLAGWFVLANVVQLLAFHLLFARWCPQFWEPAVRSR